MAHFAISPDLTAEQLGLGHDEQVIFLQLCKQRQCTSAELIQRHRISNPQQHVEQINHKLAAKHSRWQIMVSTPRAPVRTHTQSMQISVAYYRLCKVHHLPCSTKIDATDK
ncbi:hypothetical protein [Chitinibacter sp. S2-10]|uniref:hypothetical protein n=1 Tax=Chitinibacter sp. S2-10 TaxID=3373597 RepID=UPI0039773534